MADYQKTRYPGIFKRGERFYYFIRADGRQVKRSSHPVTGKVFTSLIEAKKARDGELVDRQRGEFTEPVDLTFGAWLGDWLSHLEIRALTGEVKASSLAGGRLVVEAYLKPALGSVRLQDLTAARLDKFYGDLLRTGRRSGTSRGHGHGLSPKTVRNLASTVHSALELARRRGLVTRNVAKDAHTPSPRRDPETLRHWTEAQLGDFLAATAADRLAPLWTLLAATGMRRGEALALRWSDVTPTAVRVTKGRTTFAGEVREGTPKTDRSRRAVALDPETLAVLEAWRERQAEEAVAVEAAGVPYNADGHIFTDEIGRAWHPSTVSRTFDRLVQSSGVERVTLHALRHTHATLLLRAGVPVEVVSKRLGHASVAITLEVYRHVLPEENDAAAAVAGQLVHGQRHLRSVG